MKYLADYKEGNSVNEIYFCKQRTLKTTKNGKSYEDLILQDKTGTMDAKIWDIHSPGIEDFEAMEYIFVAGKVTSFNNALQLNVDRIRVASEGEYNPADYMPMSRYDRMEMYNSLKDMILSIQNPYCQQLLSSFYIEDKAFMQRFCSASAARSVHHGFVGGLLEHTLRVTQLCDFYCRQYPILKRDLLLTAAMCHDIGKVKEIAAFPVNDYTDDGNLLGHIIIGCEMVRDAAAKIPDFPPVLLSELKHCILSHHGELEFGSPKKPALIEAVALSFADNTDAKIETFTELLENASHTAGQEMSQLGWLGFNRTLDSNVRPTKMQ